MKTLLIQTTAFSLFLMEFVSGVGASELLTGQQATIGRSKAVTVHNVELTPEGLLNAQVVNAHGQPLTGVAVELVKGENPVTLISDSDGRFLAGPFGGGLCVFRIDESQYACRTWKHGTAPVGYIPSIALVDESAPIILGSNGRSDRNANNCCPPEQRACSLEKKYGLAILALGATAAVLAITRANASE